MKKAVAIAALSLALTALTAQAQVLGSCVTRTINATFSGSTWMAQPVCAPNEIAVSGGGFCSQAGLMIGASTTTGRADNQVWLQCTRPGPAVWYGMCCQQVERHRAVQAPHSCVTRTVNGTFSGSTWMAQAVCAPNEIAISGGGFCSQAGQMVGSGTTKGPLDQKAWLQCTRPGPAVWYAMCCQI